MQITNKEWKNSLKLLIAQLKNWTIKYLDSSDIEINTYKEYNVGIIQINKLKLKYYGTPEIFNQFNTPYVEIIGPNKFMFLFLYKNNIGCRYEWCLVDKKPITYEVFKIMYEDL